ncbi:MAG: T9SS type A sorting domain-containing protein [bacterium]|nr:MAG: T9SS type A sorting domain-containing protein [bacterium]
MRRNCKFALILYLGLVIVGIPSAWAYWVDDGVAIITGTGAHYPQITSDGSGGAIITWYDLRGVLPEDIYAQRIDAAGNLRWASGGVIICGASGYQGSPKITSDGSGGAIIIWYDNRSVTSMDIYAQRVDAFGNVQWIEDGVVVCTEWEYGEDPQIISDGSGGAIIAWQEDPMGTGEEDIYAQRIDADGSVLWTAEGEAICTVPEDNQNPQLVSDGSGGAIITWQDARNETTKWDIYAQRVDAFGYVQWTPDGVAICTESSWQWYPQLTSDGSGGAIITWQDERGMANIYAQRVSAGGTVLWAAGGVAVCTAAEGQEYPRITTDGSGGAVITWEDTRNISSERDIYAQRIDAGGTVLWTADGVAICTALEWQYNPRITSNGSGGAIITWIEEYTGGSDIYAQGISAGGSVQWAENGVAICTASGYQLYPQITTDGAGGAIIAWHDGRSTPGACEEIYAQRTLYVTGDDPSVTPMTTYLDQNFPNPFNPITTIHFGLKEPAHVSLNVYDVSGSLVRVLLNEWRMAGHHEEIWDGTDSRGSAAASGVYFYRLSTGSFTEAKKIILLR